MSTGGNDPKAIESISPENLRSNPAGRPPPGIQPDFVDPPSLVPAILGVGAAFLALALFCYSIRIYTKLFITRKWQWDDGKSNLILGSNTLRGLGLTLVKRHVR